MNINDSIKTLSTLLRDNNLKLATAESCTGGMLGMYLTQYPGSSNIYDRGFVTYSNDAKHDLLGVSSDILKTHGAVSKECAEAMALGTLNHNKNCDIAVSITGIAGPGGHTEEKPVGLVYISSCLRDSIPTTKEYHFLGNRAQIREESCEQALMLMIDSIGIK